MCAFEIKAIQKHTTVRLITPRPENNMLLWMCELACIVFQSELIYKWRRIKRHQCWQTFLKSGFLMAQVISGLGSSDIQDCALDKKSAFTSIGWYDSTGRLYERACKISIFEDFQGLARKILTRAVPMPTIYLPWVVCWTRWPPSTIFMIPLSLYCALHYQVFTAVTHFTLPMLTWQCALSEVFFNFLKNI